MQFTFAKVMIHEKVPDLVGWFLEVTDMETYIEWFNTFQVGRIRDGYLNLYDHQTKHQHMSHDYAQLIGIEAGIIADERGRKNFSILDPEDMRRLHERLEGGKVKCVQRGIPIYINPVGGWFIVHDKSQVLDRIVTDQMIFPSEKNNFVVISQWVKNGHWYLKGTLSGDHPEKYTTVEDATEAALKLTGGNMSCISVHNVPRFVEEKDGD